MTDPEILAAVRAEGLRYVSDIAPGIHRIRHGKAFRYQTPDGKPLRDKPTLERIRKLAIPPAYEKVWICVHPNGHLQATGRDARGRKQYRYHPGWREVRDADKFSRMLQFGAALPRIRARVERDLTQRGLAREKILATVVRLLDTTLVRVGNDEYAKSNHSYGLTTLRNRHADVHGSTLTLQFRGKSGIEHTVKLNDPRVARIVRICQEMPGQDLFQYLDDDGKPHGIGSVDVNDYLRSVSGGEFTAKDFRTWHATVLALDLLADERAESMTAAKRTATQMLAKVAAKLGNTVAVCRKAYVHPRVLECFVAGRLSQDLQAIAEAKMRRGLVASERRLLGFLAPAKRHSAKAIRAQASALAP